MSALHRAASAALTLVDPEAAHRLAITALKLGLGPVARTAPDPILAQTLAGLALPTPVGLAAGFDKNAQVANAMLRAGFGFVECGTVTPLAQHGNSRPRLFRLTADRAVINRLGFNNLGLEAFARRLAARSRQGVVGANIGANKESADRIADYVEGLRRLWGLADYFTVNISSPNTPGLRDLQGRGALTDLLGALGEARAGLPDHDAPIFLKVAPDLTGTEIADIAEAAVRFGLAGLIVANTTLSRPDTLCDPQRNEAGGLSGAPLKDLSTAILRQFRQAAGDRLVLIGAGGVASGADAYARIRAGAHAVQLYSALVFEGPDLAVRIADDLARRLKADGFASVAEAVGAE